MKGPIPLRISPKKRKAIIASLLNCFKGLTLEDVAQFTDKQIFEYYFYPRNKEGSIELPKEEKEEEEPETLEKVMKDLAQLRSLFVIDPEQYEKLKEDARKKFANKA